MVIPSAKHSDTVKFTKTSFLQRNDEFPGYVLFTPTVVDLDSQGGPLEIIAGTSAGNLHVLDHTGTPRTGFPVLLSTLHGQVHACD